MTLTRAQAIGALRDAVAAELAALDHVLAMARDEATHAESRPENQYDTRALEASYLAAGQGQRAAELRELHGWLSLDHPPATRAAAGALTWVEVDGRARWLVLGPRGGASAVAGGETIALVSTTSPLGAALLGLAPGDVATVDGPRGESAVELLAVQ